jgi:hypothetical protein
VDRLSNPGDPATIPGDAALLANLVVPPDFRREILSSSAAIFEIDRRAAGIPWEMLAKLDDEITTAGPMAFDVCVSRQLRTTYSPPPSRAPAPNNPLRALVIGDPGSGKDGLEDARREAIEVTNALRAHGVDVVALIGPPDFEGKGELPDYPPATILEVLRQLADQFDILHFAGHAEFDDNDTSRAGWVFNDGKLFTSRELGAAAKIPRLVVANACSSGVLAMSPRSDPERAAPQRRESDLLPGLADEFFKRGVRNYVGTAWPVSSVGAVHFATAFYSKLLSPVSNGGATLGEALKAARIDLNGKEAMFGALWAAYRHYGDPSVRLLEAEDVMGSQQKGKTMKKGGGK